MSAIEHPAARSGSTTFWCGSERMSATSAMKCTPQNTMNSASCSRGELRELQRVAGQVGVLVHVGALIVMPENHQALAERVLGRRNARVHLVVGEAQVRLRERLPLADALLLDAGEEVDVHCVRLMAQASGSGRLRLDWSKGSPEPEPRALSRIFIVTPRRVHRLARPHPLPRCTTCPARRARGPPRG